MLAAITRCPRRLARHAKVLASFHRRLHVIDAPAGDAPRPTSRTPGCSWRLRRPPTRASSDGSGPRSSDASRTPLVGELDRATVAPFLRPVVDGRAADRNMRPAELEAMYRIVEREERRLARGAGRS